MCQWERQKQQSKRFGDVGAVTGLEENSQEADGDCESPGK